MIGGPNGSKHNKKSAILRPLCTFNVMWTCHSKKSRLRGAATKNVQEDTVTQLIGEAANRSVNMIHVNGLRRVGNERNEADGPFHIIKNPGPLKTGGCEACEGGVRRTSCVSRSPGSRA